ncbi:hypothetical protein Bca52824_049648 [Brassica carinata]|uniref:Uncharacterized protein n=1 Tax=Brassica carinata TaxID=52824 RepID=A0A8X7RJ59_BRACI|nr:hypothetical protein Bca52824_049648 [Brassica carinata]
MNAPLDSLQVMYGNSDDAFCLRKPWQATSTLKLTVLTRSGAEEGINPLVFFLASHADLKVPGICILQFLFTGEDDTWKSWLNAVMPALLNLRQFSKIFWN